MFQFRQAGQELANGVVIKLYPNESILYRNDRPKAICRLMDPRTDIEALHARCFLSELGCFRTDEIALIQ